MSHEDPSSLSDRLAEHFGDDLDPRIQLDPSAAADKDLGERFRARAASRGPTESRYDERGELAHGGMGVVLHVWDEDLRRHLAMKVMRDDGSGPAIRSGSRTRDPRRVARFLEEAQVTSQLDHPGIVPVHELGIDAQGRLYFTMKLVRGKTLTQVLEEHAAGSGSWSREQVLGILQKVCQAMRYAHDKGVIHRDLKPSNIMVGRYGEVYVMDWGLARVLGRAEPEQRKPRGEADLSATKIRSDRHDEQGDEPDSPLWTLDGDVVGTPAYMSPEQARGELAQLGPYSDVYAVGAMLYHLLAGHMPYLPPGVRGTHRAVWLSVQMGPPKALEQIDRSLPPELVAITERAMAREIPDRYPDMGALVSDLSAYLEGRVVSAYEIGPWAEAKKWVRRNRALAAALAGAAALLLLGSGAIALVQSRARAVAEEQSSLAEALREEAEEGKKKADQEAKRAVDQEQLAQALAEDVLSLSTTRDLAELRARAEELWPPFPQLLPALERWASDAQDILHGRGIGALTGQRRPSRAAQLAKLQDLRGKVILETDAERLQRARSHARYPELVAARAELAAADGSAPRGLNESRSARILELEILVGERTFEDQVNAWWYAQLTDLVAELDHLIALETEPLADHLGQPFGWGIDRRRRFALEIEERSLSGPQARAAWAEAIEAVRESFQYEGLELEPILGLLPLGQDPHSGLWEFAHLMSGEPARRGPDGTLEFEEATGIVLVLIPAGAFTMGAQALDPGAPNYDPHARSNETLTWVELSAYLISKYALTQGQWERIVGQNPSAYEPGWHFQGYVHDLTHPVEQVSWYECRTWLARMDLTLPSEAQWEYAARARTTTPWWTGFERESLRGRANFADQAAARADANWGDIQDWPDLDDGYVGHAPVDAFSPNGFGLYQVAGNVWEWCLDGNDSGPRVVFEQIRDPYVPFEGAPRRVIRGGSFYNTASSSRSAYQDNHLPSASHRNLGVRPARALRPPG